MRRRSAASLLIGRSRSDHPFPYSSSHRWQTRLCNSDMQPGNSNNGIGPRLDAPLVIFMQILLFYLFQHCTRFPAFRKWLHFSYFLPAPAAEGGFQCQVCSAPIFSASFSFFFYLRNLWWYRISRNKKRGERGEESPAASQPWEDPPLSLKDVLVRTPFSRKRKRASASAAASTSPHTLCQTRRVKKGRKK